MRSGTVPANIWKDSRLPSTGASGRRSCWAALRAGIAIVNGTIAAAIGLGLQQWIAGFVLWAVGHSIAVFAARRDPDFAPVLIRHLRQKGYLTC